MQVNGLTGLVDARAKRGYSAQAESLGRYVGPRYSSTASDTMPPARGLALSYIGELRALVGTRPLILPGAAVIVVDSRQQILLLQRADTGGWGLPGGFMDPSETLEETARREVMEETGLEIDDLSLMHVFSGPAQYFRYPNGDEVFNVTTVYTATSRDWSYRLDPQEVAAAELFAVDRIPSELIAPEVPILEYYAKNCHAFSVTLGARRSDVSDFP